MKTMKTVNPFLFIELLEPLVGMADVDEQVEFYQAINPDSEEEMKRTILDVLKPHFDALSQVKKERCKLTLSYYLTTSKIDFERIFDSYLLPFDPPSPVELFFVWLWETLFENEDYTLESPEQFIEKEDIDEPKRH